MRHTRHHNRITAAGQGNGPAARGAGQRRPRPRTRRTQILVTSLLALALITAACSGGESVPTDGPEGEAAARGGTFVAAISSEPDHFDPHSTTASPSFLVLENVYDTLVEPDPELNFHPALATDWEVSDDRLTWTFQLRKDVQWHNGRQFTADDVVFSLDRLRAPDSARAFRYESVKKVVAVDDHTVEIRLSRPTPNLLANLGGFKGFAIIPREIVKNKTIRKHPIGTGPFRFESYTPGDRVVLEANPDYWGEGPFVDRVEIEFISEPTTALTALRTEEVHWTNNVPPQQISSLSEDDAVVLGQMPSIDYWYFTFNQNREPFDDVRVRQALTFAVDREAVTEAAKFDAATVNQTAMPKQSYWFFDYAPYEHDPERARELLDEAGVEDLNIDLMLTNEFPETIRAAQVIASQWKEVGVNAKLRTLDFAAWLDEQGKGNYDSYVLGWLNNIDPEYAYYAQHHCDGSFNFQNFCNPQVDQFLEQARREPNRERRKELYNNAAKIIVDEASYSYLYNPDIVHAWLPSVEGYEMHPDGVLRARTIQLQQ